MTIIRRPDFAGGGITADERAEMEKIAEIYTANAFRTDRIDEAEAKAAIKELYAVSGLDEPTVVVVPSPIVMAAAYGAAAATWATHEATCAVADAATRAATRKATHAATDEATRRATHAATRRATHVATRAAIVSAIDEAIDEATRTATHVATRAVTVSAIDEAVYAATREATYEATSKATGEATAMAACRDIAGSDGVEAARMWAYVYQGGNMWTWYESYFEACRDVLGLKLPEFGKYAAWERCAKAGGFRILHPKFCIVSDFPERLLVDEQNRPHCEAGPSHRWRDGWELYHWHGTRVPGHWITGEPDPDEILRHDDAKVRAAGVAIIGL